MKLISSLLIFCSAQQVEIEPKARPGMQNGPGPGAMALQNMLIPGSGFGTDDGKARPKPNWKPGSSNNRPTQKPVGQRPVAVRPTKRPVQPGNRPNNQRPPQRPTNQRPQGQAAANQRPTQRPNQQRPAATKRPTTRQTTRRTTRGTTRKPFRPTKRPAAKPQGQQKEASAGNQASASNHKEAASGASSYNPAYQSSGSSYSGGSQYPQYQAPTTKKPYYTTTKYTTTTKKDVNECYLGTDNCHYNAKCVNTYGSYDCICNNGYNGNGYACQPKDVDECSNGSHNCNSYATCTNTVGSYTCTCSSGYTGNGYSCQELAVNECTNGQNNCSPYADCIDKYNGFRCKCKNGYEGDGVTCSASDPCNPSPCSSGATCSAGAYGGFTCSCASGYSGSGQGYSGCSDDDECYNGSHNCDATATCLNSNGGYSCACSTGYSGNGYSCEQDDVDECYLGTDNCASNAICTNTETGYACACPDGWSGDGMTCYEDAPDVQTCGEYNPCSSGATCMDTTDGPQCMCGKGYKGNGRLFENSDEHKARPVWASTYDTDSGTGTGGDVPAGYEASSGSSEGSSSYSGSSSSGSSSSYSEPSSSGSTYSGSSGTSSSGSSYSEPSSSGSTYSGSSSSGSSGSSSYSGPGTGCDDVDECAGCGGSYGGCPCSDPTPICSNTAGGYTCGIDTAFGDPHFRVTAPGQMPVCFDVDTPSGAIIDLFSDAQSALEINAQFKNVHNGKKQFIKAIGFTSQKGLQLAVTPTMVEVYENGKQFITYNITSDHVDERMFDVRMILKPADHENHHNRHTVDIIQDDGQKFRFAVKPGAGSLSFDLEGIHGIKSPTGIIGQWLNPGSYTIDEANNIETEFVHIPSKDRAWHAEHQCHQIGQHHVEAFLGRPIRDYQLDNLFSNLFYRGAQTATLIEAEDESPK